jgi:hypothetical protein
MASVNYHALPVLVVALLLPRGILSGNDVVVNNCTLCVPDDNDSSLAIITNPSASIIDGTCQSVYDKGNLTLSQSNCTILQTLGTIVCGCTSDLNMSATDEDEGICTLCQDGNALSQPLIKVIPGSSCAELQIDAIRDAPERCIYHQEIVGTYCGCSHTVENDDPGICRLCAPLLIPRPDRIVDGLSCLQHEFRASIFNNCTMHQDLYAEECCVDDVPSAAPSRADEATQEPAPSVSPTASPASSVSRTSVLSNVSIVVHLLWSLWSLRG